MAKKRLRLSVKARTGKAKFEEAKHRRDAQGQFADKPGTKDDTLAGYSRAQLQEWGLLKEVQDYKQIGMDDDWIRRLVENNKPGAGFLSVSGGGDPYKDPATAVSAYSGQEAFTINRSLRTSKGNLRKMTPDEDSELTAKELRQVVVSMDRAIDSAPPLTRPRTFYRAVEAGLWDELQPGAEIVDHGFTSVSQTRDALEALEFISEGGGRSVMRVTVPSGAKALDVNKMEAADRPEEQEWILPRGGRYRFNGRDATGEFLFEMLL